MKTIELLVKSFSSGGFCIYTNRIVHDLKNNGMYTIFNSLCGKMENPSVWCKKCKD